VISYVTTTTIFGIGVLLGNGNGTFKTPVLYSSGDSNGYPGIVTLADVNNDGKLDIIETNGDNTVSVCSTRAKESLARLLFSREETGARSPPAISITMAKSTSPSTTGPTTASISFWETEMVRSSHGGLSGGEPSRMGGSWRFQQ